MTNTALVVTRDEMHRWLPLTLGRLRDQFDHVVVYDDHSTDDTVTYARDIGCDLVVTSALQVTLLDDEAVVRENAWVYAVRELELTAEDRIVVVDADEIVLGAPDVWDLASRAGVYSPIREIWQLDPPMRRVDGFWGTIGGWRIGSAVYGSFRQQKLAGGSIPVEQRVAGIGNPDGRVVFCHLGYVNQQDRQDKYDRYRGRTGHSTPHVASIVTTPKLEPLGDALTDTDQAFFEAAANYRRIPAWP